MQAARDILTRLTKQAAESGDRGRTRHVRLGKDAIEEIGPWLEVTHPGSIDVVVADAHTWDAAGARVEESLRSAGRTVTRLVLEPREGDPKLVCEDGVIVALQTFLHVSEKTNPIAVGAGTVTDIVKMASFRLSRPFQIVPTAASMNGYTSSIAAVLSAGVKRTGASHQAEALFADVDVLRKAPPVMNRAGFGDLLSKPYSNADWLLSHLVRGVPYSDEAASLLDEPWRRMVEEARGIGEGDPAALEVLMETLLVSGFSMAIAGTSAPASGSEHLISHYWDMEELCQGRPVRALHGTQVGIGTRLAAKLIDRMVRLDPEDLDAAAAAERRPDLAFVDRIGADHPDLTPDVLAEIQDQLRQKQRTGAALRDEIAALRTRWPEVREKLRASLLPPGTIDRALVLSGSADRASEIGVGLEHLVRTLRVCRHLRNRYVSFDLLDDLGVLGPWSVEVARETEAPS